MIFMYSYAGKRRQSSAQHVTEGGLTKKKKKRPTNKTGRATGWGVYHTQASPSAPPPPTAAQMTEVYRSPRQRPQARCGARPHHSPRLAHTCRAPPMSVWLSAFMPRASESADILRTAAPQASTYARSRPTTSSSATSGSRSVPSSSCRWRLRVRMRMERRTRESNPPPRYGTALFSARRG